MEKMKQCAGPSALNRYKIWLPLFGALMISVGMVVEWWLLRPAPLSPAEKKLREVYELISAKYVDEVSIDSLIELTIPALFNSLDPHTVYIPASEREDADGLIEGTFSGIGVQFRIENDEIVIAEVIDGGPGEKVGLMAGDVIVEIDGEVVADIGIDEAGVRKRLRGDKGTKVKVSVRREGLDDLLDFDIIRGEVPVTSIDAAFMLDKTTGLIKINSFSRNTYQEFLNAVQRLSEQGAEDYIIDLRYNGGGLMGPAVQIANEFLPRGRDIVSTRGKIKALDERIISDGTGSLQDARVVVLVNENSASSSEILSGAIQDNDRGLILGRRTFGKGLVQEPINLSDGSEVRLTIQRYYTPSGRSIQKNYTLGKHDSYNEELLERLENGELMELDSSKINFDLVYKTVGGRLVYGGGGILPDIFVPEDTSRVTNYYADVARRGLLTKFANEYVSLNRKQLMKSKTVESILSQLPPDDIILSSFADYARMNGVAPRWYYINISADLIVTELKALIAYDVLGREAYYKVFRSIDNNLDAALKAIKEGKADAPIR